VSEALVVLDHDLDQELDLVISAEFDLCRSFFLLFHQLIGFLLLLCEFGLVQVLSESVFLDTVDVSSNANAFAVVTRVLTASLEVD